MKSKALEAMYVSVYGASFQARTGAKLAVEDLLTQPTVPCQDVSGTLSPELTGGQWGIQEHRKRDHAGIIFP